MKIAFETGNFTKKRRKKRERISIFAHKNPMKRTTSERKETENSDSIRMKIKSFDEQHSKCMK